MKNQTQSDIALKISNIVPTIVCTDLNVLKTKNWNSKFLQKLHERSKSI